MLFDFYFSIFSFVNVAKAIPSLKLLTISWVLLVVEQ